MKDSEALLVAKQVIFATSLLNAALAKGVSDETCQLTEAYINSAISALKVASELVRQHIAQGVKEEGTEGGIADE